MRLYSVKIPPVKAHPGLSMQSKPEMFACGLERKIDILF